MSQFKTATEAYIDNLLSDRCSPDTISSYRGILSQFERFLGEREVTPTVIMEYKKELAGRSVKGSTIAYHLNILRYFFDWASDPMIKLFPSNPVSKLLIPKNTANKSDGAYSKLFNEQEYSALFTPHRPNNPNGRSIGKKKWLRNRAIILLFLTAGLRNSELSNLTSSDLNFEDGYIKVMYGKGGKFRVVPFDALAQIAVKDYLASSIRPKTLTETDLLFGSLKGTGEWHKMTRQGISNIVELTISQLTEREGVRSHALRHNMASYLLAAGVELTDIQATLGHSNVATTQRYAEQLDPLSHIKNIDRIANVKQFRVETETYEKSVAVNG